MAPKSAARSFGVKTSDLLDPFLSREARIEKWLPQLRSQDAHGT
jgi:hypothetical protein